ncbi:MAG: aldose epimerase family protein [Roseobacter sp.]|jgi:aldose 1-epimerase|nr:aldose epimerase family protein [Roseobacter sp.]
MFTIQSDQLKAMIAPNGARLAGLWVAGREQSLVLGTSDSAGYDEDLAYFGAVIGPVANRVSDGCVVIDGHKWQMQANDGANCLHSGDAGLHAVNWHISEQSGNTVVLTTSLRHGHAGLPGRRNISAMYRIKGCELHLDVRATTDRPTVLNIAHHPYWNLSGATTVRDHRLHIAADHYLPTQSDTCPTGEIAPVLGTAYDFSQTRRIPVDRTLDASFCLAHERREACTFAARLSVSGGLALDILTTEPGLQLYNGSGLRPSDTALFDGQHLRSFAGVALEPQSWPDATRHTHFPMIWLTPDMVYASSTIYRISHE